MKLFDSRVSIEESGTVQNKEIEIVIYCKASKPESLSEASSVEQHFQYQSSFQNGENCRVRKTVKGDESKIEFTIKVKNSTDQGIEDVTEVTTSVDEEFLGVFKNIAHQHLQKTRYNFHTENIELSFKEGEETRTFKIPDVKYEVDVFKKKDGSDSEWLKIDLEVDSIMSYLGQNHPDIKNVALNVKLTHLPFEPTDIILEETATEEQKTFIKGLWDSEYNCK